MIEKVVLQKIDVVNIDGEFKEAKGEERIIPCMLTNYAVSQGKRIGLLKTSLVSELIDLASDGNIDDLNTNSVAKNLDEEKCLKAIYIGCLGANKNLGLTYDEFLELYHGTFIENVELYVKLVSDLIKKDNNFANEFKKNTVAARRGKGEKK